MNWTHHFLHGKVLLWKKVSWTKLCALWHNKNSNSVKVKALNLRLFSVLCNNKEADNAQPLLNPKYNCGGETFWESDCTTEQDFGIFKENKPT